VEKRSEKSSRGDFFDLTAKPAIPVSGGTRCLKRPDGRARIYAGRMPWPRK